MAWSNTKNELAYINKSTQALGQQNETVSALASAVLDKAIEIMNNLDEAGKTTKSTTRDGKSTYTDKAVVNVEPAAKWSREINDYEPLKHKDGSQIYKATAEIKHNGTTLTLTAKEDISEGAKFVAMTASKWDRTNGSVKLRFYKQDEIADAPINRDIRAIAAHIRSQGFLESKTPESPLRSFAVEVNQYFNGTTDKVVNESGQLVNNAYAKYTKDSYGERVTLCNHNDNIAVELGTTADGGKYAVALNYDLNRDFKSREQGEAPARVFINNTSDLEKYVALPEIREAVAEYKGSALKEKQSEHKKKAEKSGIEMD